MRDYSLRRRIAKKKGAQAATHALRMRVQEQRETGDYLPVSTSVPTASPRMMRIRSPSRPMS